jgi:hypothetical protein
MSLDVMTENIKKTQRNQQNNIDTLEYKPAKTTKWLSLDKCSFVSVYNCVVFDI